MNYYFDLRLFTKQLFNKYVINSEMLHDCYSVFILSTGFSLAVFQFWKVTVRNVITETTTKATAYTHQYIGIL